jgi:hypothetical protein
MYVCTKYVPTLSILDACLCTVFASRRGVFVLWHTYLLIPIGVVPFLDIESRKNDSNNCCLLSCVVVPVSLIPLSLTYLFVFVR